MAGLYRKILLPIDGSAEAERVLVYLPQLAIPGETTLVLVNVVESFRYAMAASRHTPPDFLEHLRSGAEAYITEQRNALQSAGYRVEAYVVEGDAAGSILQVAATAQADLIGMTTHGRSGFVAWALGSVAERVISEADLPVFLVRRSSLPTGDNFRHILMPLDGSPLAEQALPQASALAQASQAKLLLLQVAQTFDEGNRRILFRGEAEAENTLAQWRADAQAYLERLAQQMRAEGIDCAYRVLAGDVAQAIVEAAQEEKADLLVMSTHGRSGLQRWVYGSVSGKVLRSLACPLLLIRRR